MAQQLPCNNLGICMACQARPEDLEKLICVTCITPWHVTCLSSALMPTLANANNWVCPDCSNIETTSNPNLVRQPGNIEGGDLVVAMLSLENDSSLTEEEKARRRQQLLTEKNPVIEAKKDNNDDDNNSMCETLNCSICMQMLERPVTVLFTSSLTIATFFWFNP